MKATVHFYLDDDEEPVTRKVRFHDLLEMPKGERSKNLRKRLFETHLLTSSENQNKIREADKITRKKEERAINKAKLIKNLLLENMCRADTVKARELPTRVRGRGRGRIDTPKL